MALAILFALEAIASPPHRVTSELELYEVMRHVHPGDTIVLASGTYSVNLVVTRSGTSRDPIELRAEPGAAVEMIPRNRSLHTLELDGASHWRIRGVKIQDVRVVGGTDDVIE